VTEFDVSFVLKGDDRGTDHVRAGDFVHFVQRLIACLSAIDEAVHGEVAHYLRIKDLGIGSAAGTLEPVVQQSKWPRRHLYQPLADCFGELILAAHDRRPAPPWASVEVLQKTRELSETPKHVAGAKLIAASVEVEIDADFRRGVDEFIGGEVQSIGSMTGDLDAVNVHSSRLAYLYPGDGTSIACEFAEDMMDQVVASLKKRVRITGSLTRRLNSSRPVKARIFEIEQLPANSDLPLFRSLLGLSPGATGGLSGEEYLRRLRVGDD
jgi:hypothetical protein